MTTHTASSSTYFDYASYVASLAVADDVTRDSARDGGYRVWLLAQQGNRCWDCESYIPFIGEGVGEYTHIHRAAKGGVYFEGLGAIGCRRCNLIHVRIADENGSIPFRYIMARERYTRIPMGLPTRPECVAIRNADREASREAFDADVLAALADCE